MQGTAMTEAEEFFNVYKLNVIQVPSRLPNQRLDHPSRLFTNRNEKLLSIYVTVMQAHWRDRPVLIGTSSVAESEVILEVLEGLLWTPFEIEQQYRSCDLKGWKYRFRKTNDTPT